MASSKSSLARKAIKLLVLKVTFAFLKRSINAAIYLDLSANLRERTPNLSTLLKAWCKCGSTSINLRQVETTPASISNSVPLLWVCSRSSKSIVLEKHNPEA